MAKKAARPKQGTIPKQDDDQRKFSDRLSWALEHEDEVEIEQALRDRKSMNWGKKIKE